MQDFGATRMRRPAYSSIKLLLSHQLSLLSTEFSQLLGLLRVLLVKQGYFLPFGSKFMLNEPGDGGMLLVSVKRLQHSSDANVTHGRAHSLYRSPLEITQIGKAFTRRVKAFFLIQHVHVAKSLFKISYEDRWPHI